MINKIPDFLLVASDNFKQSGKKEGTNTTFLDLTLHKIAQTAKSIYIQAENTSKSSLIYTLNPYVKVISLIYLLVINSIVSGLISLSLITIFILILYIIAGINIFQIYKKIIILAFFFGFLIFIPASLNIVTPGEIILNLFSFDKFHRFWIYNIPQNIGITSQGCIVVGRLFLRVLNSISFTLLICFTTSFPKLIKSFKILGIPDSFLMIITLAYKYIFILIQTIEETYFALKARLIGITNNKNLRKLIAGRIFFIFKKSSINYEHTYFAMISRGYDGKIILFSDKKFVVTDLISLLIIISFGILVVII